MTHLSTDHHATRRALLLLLGVIAVICAPLVAQAQRPADPDALARAQDAANRPMRWIIENSRIERKKPAAVAASPAGVVAQPAADTDAERVRRKQRPSTTAAVPAPHPTPVDTPQAASPALAAARSAVVMTPGAAPAPAVAPMSLPPVALLPEPSATSTTPAAAAARTARKAPTAPVEDDDEEPLVAVSQQPPQIAPGLCAVSCDRYFYRVAFRVLPNGHVEQVRVLDTNGARFKRFVVQAVEDWRYKPVSVARNEEVILRLATE